MSTNPIPSLYESYSNFGREGLTLEGQNKRYTATFDAKISSFFLAIGLVVVLVFALAAARYIPHREAAMIGTGVYGFSALCLSSMGLSRTLPTLFGAGKEKWIAKYPPPAEETSSDSEVHSFSNELIPDPREDNF